MQTDAQSTIDLPGVQKLRSGKVREVFDLGDNLLFVATDRLSAFDVILPDPIPKKGEKILGQETADRVKDLSLQIYSAGRDHAAHRGIIVADTKFEFGTVDDKLLLIDEVLTPDSSRFWPADHYVVGQSPPSFDKQFVRDYLETLDWNKTPPGPKLPGDVVARTAAKYVEAFERLTGEKLKL